MLWVCCCSEPAKQEVQPEVKPAKGCKAGGRVWSATETQMWPTTTKPLKCPPCRFRIPYSGVFHVTSWGAVEFAVSKTIFLPQNIVYDNASKWCCNLISPIFQNVLSAHDSLGCSLLSDKAPPHPWFSCVACGRGHSGNAEGAGLHPMLWQWCTAGGMASQVPFLPVF